MEGENEADGFARSDLYQVRLELSTWTVINSALRGANSRRRREGSYQTTELGEYMTTQSLVMSLSHRLDTARSAGAEWETEVDVAMQGPQAWAVFVALREERERASKRGADDLVEKVEEAEKRLAQEVGTFSPIENE